MLRQQKRKRNENKYVCGLPMPWLMSVMYVSAEQVFYARVSKKFLFHCFSIFGLLKKKKKMWRLKDDEVEVNRWKKQTNGDENENEEAMNREGRNRKRKKSQNNKIICNSR